MSRVRTVEACMRAWKSVFVAIIPMDIESTEAIHALELLESIQRDFTRASDELEEFSALFLVE